MVGSVPGGCNGTYPYHLVILSRLRTQHWDARLFGWRLAPTARLDLPSASADLSGVLVTDPYVYCVNFRGLSRFLALLGCRP